MGKSVQRPNGTQERPSERKVAEQQQKGRTMVDATTARDNCTIRQREEGVKAADKPMHRTAQQAADSASCCLQPRSYFAACMDVFVL